MADPAIHFTTVLAAFFAIMNPVANAPVFLSVTAGLEPPARRRVATQSVLLALGIVALFTITGRALFDLFGITLPAFRIAGGVLVAMVGYHMLQGESSSVQTPTDEDNANSEEAALGLAISPLALPVLAGPGTIATAMNFAAESTFSEVTRVLGAFGVVCAATWVAFVLGERMVGFLGQNAIKVVSRLMGLILAVVGVQMLIAGIEGAIAAGSGAVAP